MTFTLDTGEVYTLESSNRLALTNKLYESFFREIENISKINEKP